MRFDLNPFDPSFALEILNCISDLQYLKIVNKNSDRFLDWGGINRYIQYSLPVTYYPPAAYFGVQDSLIMVISGAQNVQQFANLFLSSKNGDVSRTYREANLIVDESARYIFRNFQLDKTQNSTKILFCGFSFGGAIAEVLCDFMRDAPFNMPNVTACTFASPRPGLEALQKRLGNNGVRWMNQLDPVPYFPPHSDEALNITQLWQLASAPIWSRYVHPFQGLVLDTSSNITPRVLPLVDSTNAASRLVLWLTGADATVAAQHQIATYQGLLSNAALKYQAKPVVFLPLQTTAQAAANVSGTNPIFDVQARTPSNLFGVVDPLAAYIPPAFRVKAVRVGPTTYAVQWMSYNLTRTTTKSNARAIAKTWNKMLRATGTAPGVIASGIQQGFATFLQNAINGNLGFNPPWVVT
jgi:hypothetical protein